MSAHSPFLAAATGGAPSRTPVWFMRQAGRSLPEYRRIRGEGSILDAIKQPELAAEITLQPVRRYGVDAAVLYSDIVVPAHAVGFGIDVTPGTGPVAASPLRSEADLARLRPLDPDDIRYVADAVELVAKELPRGVPVLAFAGAPFTVASYLIEGRPSRDYRNTKAMMHTDERLWHRVMERLAESAITFLDVQLESRGRRLPVVRLVGRNAVARSTTSGSCFLTRDASSPNSPRATRTRRRSTSASGATICSRRCTPPGRT